MAENDQYKGFAYTKDGKKPTVVYGTSAEDILAKLNAYNIARTENDKFKTCNIGELDMETSRYGDYHKYEVATGKDISSVYLPIPALGKTEFQKVVSDLKAAGARFSPYKKAWYITADQELEKFQAICNQFSTETQIPEEQEPQAEHDFQITGITVQYAVKMENQQTVIIPDSAINMFSLNGSAWDEFFNKLNEKAVEQLQQLPSIPDDPQQLVDDSEYSIGVSQEARDNRCTVWFNDGREPINLSGDQYGIHFPDMSAEEVADFVAEYIRQQGQLEQSRPEEYRVGDRIDCYVPLRLQDNAVIRDQPLYVENIRHVAGTVQAVQPLAEGSYKYIVSDDSGNTQTVRSDEIYAPDQAKVLLRAAADELTGVQFDLLADRRLSAAQMEEIRFGFKDGLKVEQVALYANPEMTSAEMDMCRIGLNNGLGYAEISRLLKETKELSWTDSRNRLNDAIKGREREEPVRKDQLESQPEEQNKTAGKVETADFYGTEYLVKDGKRVIPQEAIDDMLAEIEAPDLTGCIFRDIDFGRIAYNNVLPDVNFANSEFHNCKFDDLDLRRCSFQGASLYHTSFNNTALKQCDFEGARMADCVVKNSDISHVNFSSAAMERTAFQDCLMENNDFNRTQMDAVEVDSACSITADQQHIDTVTYTVSGADPEEIASKKDQIMWRLSGSEITYERKEELSQLWGAESNDPDTQEWRYDLTYEERNLVDSWDNSRVREVEPDEVTPKDAAKESFADPAKGGQEQKIITQEIYEKMMSKGMGGAGQDFTNCVFKGVKFNWFRSQMPYTDQPVIDLMDFHGANFENSRFIDCDFSSTHFYNSSFENCHINNCIFSRNHINHCNFSHAWISDTKMSDIDMVHSNLFKACINETNISNSQLIGNNFFGVTVHGNPNLKACFAVRNRHVDKINYSFGAWEQHAEVLGAQDREQMSGVSDARQKEFQEDFHNRSQWTDLTEKEHQLVENWEKRWDAYVSEIETLRKRELAIADNMRTAGWKPTNGVVDYMMRLEQITGNVYTLQDVCDLCKKPQDIRLKDMSESDRTLFHKALEGIAQEYKDQEIASDIKKSGFQPTESIVSNIKKLDALTGEKHSLKDVVKLYRENRFQSNEAVSETVHKIAEECKAQELARMTQQAAPAV